MFATRNKSICLEQQPNPVGPIGHNVRGETREKQKEAIVENKDKKKVTTAT